VLSIEQLRPSINLRLLSSDAFSTLDDVAQQLGDLPINRVSRGEDNLRLPLNLGPRAARPSERPLRDIPETKIMVAAGGC
jgi:hypothetical protein